MAKFSAARLGLLELLGSDLGSSLPLRLSSQYILGHLAQSSQLLVGRTVIAPSSIVSFDKWAILKVMRYTERVTYSEEQIVHIGNISFPFPTSSSS